MVLGYAYREGWHHDCAGFTRGAFCNERHVQCVGSEGEVVTVLFGCADGNEHDGVAIRCGAGFRPGEVFELPGIFLNYKICSEIAHKSASVFQTRSNTRRWFSPTTFAMSSVEYPRSSMPAMKFVMCGYTANPCVKPSYAFKSMRVCAV